MTGWSCKSIRLGKKPLGGHFSRFCRDKGFDIRSRTDFVRALLPLLKAVGVNDDSRAFCSIPARHDVARRVDCACLATLVATGRLSEEDTVEVAVDLTYNLPKSAYCL